MQPWISEGEDSGWSLNANRGPTYTSEILGRKMQDLLLYIP